MRIERPDALHCMPSMLRIVHPSPLDGSVELRSREFDRRDISWCQQVGRRRERRTRAGIMVRWSGAAEHTCSIRDVISHDKAAPRSPVQHTTRDQRVSADPPFFAPFFQRAPVDALCTRDRFFHILWVRRRCTWHVEVYMALCGAVAASTFHLAAKMGPTAQCGSTRSIPHRLRFLRRRFCIRRSRLQATLAGGVRIP